MSEYRVTFSELTDTIYYGKVKEDKDHPGVYIAQGEQQDITDQCLGAVFRWFMNHKKDGQDFYLQYKNAPYRLIITDKDTDNVE